MLLRVILALWVTSESSESMIKKYVTLSQLPGGELCFGKPSCCWQSVGDKFLQTGKYIGGMT